jgi:hypothetical protein
MQGRQRVDDRRDEGPAAKSWAATPVSGEQEPERRKRPLGQDLVIPLSGAAFAIYYLGTVWELPWQASSTGVFIISVMTVLLLLLAVRFAGELRRGEADLRFGDLVHPLPIFARRVGMLLLALAFIYSMAYLGFTIGLFVFIVLGIMLLSGVAYLRQAVLIALGVSIGGYLLFIVFVRARFPRGPFEQFIASFW